MIIREEGESPHQVRLTLNLDEAKMLLETLEREMDDIQPGEKGEIEILLMSDEDA